MRSADYWRRTGDDSRDLATDLEPDSARMIVTFAAFGGGQVVKQYAFFTALADIDVKVALLRDSHKSWYHRGVRGVGANIDQVADFLRGLARNAEEVVMLGTSAGAYAAILFGSLLGVEAHAFSPQVFIDPQLRRRYGDKRFAAQVEDLGADMDMRYADLRPLVARAQAPVHVYYSTGHGFDRVHAEHLADLGNVTLHGFEWDSHLLVRELRERGWLQPFLERLAEGRD